MLPTRTVKIGGTLLPVVVWTGSAQLETTPECTNPPVLFGSFVVEVAKFYFHKEVEQRGYPGVVFSSIQLIESRLVTEGQVAFLGGVFLGKL